MPDGSMGEEERMWATDKREFVADSRDDVADLRDAVADAREHTADAREAELDEREAQLDARARELGQGATGTVEAVERAESGARRGRVRADRASLREQREAASRKRDEATNRRLTEGQPTMLAMAFAQIAEQLYDAETFDDVLTRIVEAAVSTLAGVSSASVTLKDAGGYHTAAATDASATAVDKEQYQADEGPCLDALSVLVVSAPSFPDERWPVLGSRPVEHGVQSALSYHLTGASRAGQPTDGSLNTYGAAPNAFTIDAQEIGSILAAQPPSLPGQWESATAWKVWAVNSRTPCLPAT